MKNVLIIGLLLIGLTNLFGAITIESIYSDNMVIQRGKIIPVSGSAVANQEVKLTFESQVISTKADENGNWQVKLQPLDANKNPQVLTVKSGDDILEIKNILIGEVWLCSGQSNMELPLWGTNPRFRQINGDEIAQSAENNLIRFIKFERARSSVPVTDFPHKWQMVTPISIQPFSATAYFFAKELQESLDIPIGLIGSYWSGTRIEPWTSPEGFRTIKSLGEITDRVDAQLPNTERFKEVNNQVLKDHYAWLKKLEYAIANNQVLPEKPVYPTCLNPYVNHQEPTVLYNKMVYPFKDFPFQGMIWYQGCSNLADGALYTDKMQALYNGAKIVFNNPNMPFYFVQLAPFGYGGLVSNDRLPILWEAQEKFANNNADNVAMAVINDYGNLSDIHPADKRQVGYRLALLAKKNTYGFKDIKANSPILDKYEIKDDKFILTFKNVEEFKNLATDKSINFEIANFDGKYEKANFEINKNIITVYSDSIKNPKNLRFMWDQLAECSLTNEVDLPLGAFRIEDDITDLTKMEEELDKNYQLVYKYDLRSGMIENNSKVNYLIDNSNQIKSFSKISYLVVTKDLNDKSLWVNITLDAFTNNIKHIAVPTKDSGARFQMFVNNLVVQTNIPTISKGAIKQGNIEFTYTNYQAKNSKSISNASNTTYDFGDTILGQADNAGYGCMQIHNYLKKETIFAFNNFKAKENADFGFGNNQTKNPDWTFSQGLQQYKDATLYIYVK